MKKKTAFRIAAENYAAGRYEFKDRPQSDREYSYDYYGCCEVLHNTFFGTEAEKCPGVGTKEHKEFFIKYFKPNDDESLNSFPALWLTSIDRTPEQNRNDRILDLLICEQIWIQEQNK